MHKHWAFSTFSAGTDWVTAPAQAGVGDRGCSFPLSRGGTVWRDRVILVARRLESIACPVCMLICFHGEKEIAEIPEKIASRQRLIVNSDRKVPREG